MYLRKNKLSKEKARDSEAGEAKGERTSKMWVVVNREKNSRML